MSRCSRAATIVQSRTLLSLSSPFFRHSNTSAVYIQHSLGENGGWICTACWCRAPATSKSVRSALIRGRLGDLPLGQCLQTARIRPATSDREVLQAASHRSSQDCHGSPHDDGGRRQQTERKARRQERQPRKAAEGDIKDGSQPKTARRRTERERPLGQP